MDEEGIMRKILILLAFNIPMAVLIFLVMSRAR